MTGIGFLLAANEGAPTFVAEVPPGNGFDVRPESGFVPDGDTAEKIADVIFRRFFHAEDVDLQRPFTTKLADDVWIVTGTVPRGVLGGPAEIHIRKKDGQILHLSHGQ
jgi:hypothetical protein